METRMVYAVMGTLWGEPFQGDYDILDDGSEVCWCRDNAGRLREIVVNDRQGRTPKGVSGLVFLSAPVGFPSGGRL